MGSYTFVKQDKYAKRHGLEGPFQYANGRVLYYDSKEGKYYDPSTDFYVENDEIDMLNQYMFDKINLASVK